MGSPEVPGTALGVRGRRAEPQSAALGPGWHTGSETAGLASQMEAEQGNSNQWAKHRMGNRRQAGEVSNAVPGALSQLPASRRAPYGPNHLPTLGRKAEKQSSALVQLSHMGKPFLVLWQQEDLVKLHRSFS